MTCRATVALGLILGGALTVAVGTIHGVVSHVRAMDYYGGLPQGRVYIRYRAVDGTLVELMDFQPASDCLDGPVWDALLAAERDQREYSFANYEERALGIPRPVVRYWWRGRQACRPREGLDGRAGPDLPLILEYRMHWPGLVGNTATWGAAGLLVLRVPAWLRYCRRRRRNLCATCGYDLHGNVSGRCPECGTAAPQPMQGRGADQ